VAYRVAGLWTVEARKEEKRRKCSVRFACTQEMEEGVSNVSAHDLCIPYIYRDIMVDGSPITGAALRGKGRKDRPLMPVHIPRTRDALDTRKPGAMH